MYPVAFVSESELYLHHTWAEKPPTLAQLVSADDDLAKFVEEATSGSKEKPDDDDDAEDNDDNTDAEVNEDEEDSGDNFEYQVLSAVEDATVLYKVACELLRSMEKVSKSLATSGLKNEDFDTLNKLISKLKKSLSRIDSSAIPAT